MAAPLIEVRVAAVAPEAEGILALELRGVAGPLPPFTAGAHVDLHLANGMVRSYSLMNEPGEAARYLIAVQREAAGRGGSAYVHEHLREGTVLAISPPRNNFGLDEAAPQSVLVAGGIGVTPLVSMAARLQALGRSWEMHYSARTRRHAAALARLARHGERVRLNFDQEPGGRMLDLAGIVAAAPEGSHFYCCGPAPMLEAFRRATAGLAAARVHLEHFSAPAQEAAAPDAAGEREFEVVLRRSDRRFTVPAGRTILDVLIDAGFDVDYSCREGVCGSCETPVREGCPAHRDLVLTEAEKAAGRTMMICCSGSRSATLVLDL